MKFPLSEEQQLLRDNVERFLEQHAPVSQLRVLRDTNDPQGFDPNVWREMIAQGWPGIASSPELGGSQMGQVGLGIIMECLGRTLSASPMEATVMMGIPWLTHAAARAAHHDVLRSAIAGDTLLTLAVQEQPRFSTHDLRTQIIRSGNELRLRGRKIGVLDVDVADQFIVIGRDPADARALIAVLVDKRAPGVVRRRARSLDSRHVGELELNDAIVPASAILDEPSSAGATLQRIETIVAAQSAAQLLGLCLHVFQMTCEYLKTREQFGVKLGTFQGLQHRAATLFCELEACKSIVPVALAAIDEDSEDAAWLASAAKTKLCRISQLAVNEAIQMHGGIGVTDELDLGLYLKRAKTLQQLMGGECYHLDRFARLRGY